KYTFFAGDGRPLPMAPKQPARFTVFPRAWAIRTRVQTDSPSSPSSSVLSAHSLSRFARIAFNSTMMMVSLFSAHHATSSASAITRAAISHAGTLFPGRLGDQLRHRRAVGHRLDHDNVAGIEDHLVRRMPLLTALHQNAGLLLGLLINRGLDVEYIRQDRVIGIQVGNLAEIHLVVVQQHRLISLRFGRQHLLGRKPEHQCGDNDDCPHPCRKRFYAHESFAGPSAMVRPRRPIRKAARAPKPPANSSHVEGSGAAEALPPMISSSSLWFAP